jgi:HK97 family phage prohead protease
VLSVPQAKQAYDLMREGVVKGLSIGYRTIKETMVGNIRHLKELRLFEGSLVTLSMNPLATITAVKTLEPEQDREALEAFRNAARDLRDFHRRMID